MINPSDLKASVILLAILAGFIGWGVIECLAWLASNIRITWGG